MNELTEKLWDVSDAYEGFIHAVQTYTRKKKERLNKVLSFIDENPGALSSDILEFIYFQPDFQEDVVPKISVSYLQKSS